MISVKGTEENPSKQIGWNFSAPIREFEFEGDLYCPSSLTDQKLMIITDFTNYGGQYDMFNGNNNYFKFNYGSNGKHFHMRCHSLYDADLGKWISDTVTDSGTVINYQVNLNKSTATNITKLFLKELWSSNVLIAPSTGHLKVKYL